MAEGMLRRIEYGRVELLTRPYYGVLEYVTTLGGFHA